LERGHNSSSQMPPFRCSPNWRNIFALLTFVLMFCTAGCIQWLSYEHRNSIYGILLGTQYTTVPDCQEYCVITPQCVAIDFNLVLSRCWVHLDPNNLRPENTFGLRNVTQYQIFRTCATLTTPTTASTTSGATGTTGDIYRC